MFKLLKQYFFDISEHSKIEPGMGPETYFFAISERASVTAAIPGPIPGAGVVHGPIAGGIFPPISGRGGKPIETHIFTLIYFWGTFLGL